MAEAKSRRRRQDRGSGREESESERLDRNLSELLQELRVALPGVQVLFAFLLTVPFTQRFSTLTPFQEKLYFGILLGTALATVLFISPTALHRILFRMQEKEFLVIASNRLALAALAVLALSMTGVVLLISDLLFTETAAKIAAGATALVFSAFWFAWPMMRRLGADEAEDY